MVTVAETCDECACAVVCEVCQLPLRPQHVFHTVRCFLQVAHALIYSYTHNQTHSVAEVLLGWVGQCRRDRLCTREVRTCVGYSYLSKSCRVRWSSTGCGFCGFVAYREDLPLCCLVSVPRPPLHCRTFDCSITRTYISVLTLYLPCVTCVAVLACTCAHALLALL